jgi:hypothetical protein
MAGGFRPGPVDDLGEALVIDDGTLALTETPAPAPVGLQAKGGGGGKPDDAALGNQVVSFARGRINQRVGRGECFDLVDQALRNAGAKSAADFGAVSPDADYVWGDPVTLSQVRPGDIIQFRNYSYDRTVETTTATETDTRTDSQVRPHHTVIVERVGQDGALTVLEQNIPPGVGPVQHCLLFFSSFHNSSGNQTTSVTVQGRVWFYRPQAR